jgi:hypothetical protein
MIEGNPPYNWGAFREIQHALAHVRQHEFDASTGRQSHFLGTDSFSQRGSPGKDGLCGTLVQPAVNIKPQKLRTPGRRSFDEFCIAQERQRARVCVRHNHGQNAAVQCQQLDIDGTGIEGRARG